MKDLFVRRVYTHENGISVVIEIDYIKKTVSLVEKDGKPKKYLFAERTPGYLGGWINILTAMNWAIAEVRIELSKMDEKESEDFVKLFVELDESLNDEESTEVRNETWSKGKQ